MGNICSPRSKLHEWWPSGPIVPIWWPLCRYFVVFFRLRFLGGQGGGWLCFVVRFFLGPLIVRVPLDWQALSFDTLAGVPLPPLLMNAGGFSILCLFLCFFPFYSLLFLPFALVDFEEV